ncbi:MAG: tRNA lysidine(34) synthetase TilS [Alphaproteobacteria bacterium]
MTSTTATAIGPDEFAALMAGFAPFESTPALAVGVSGGADSMALCLLMDAWARARGGSVTALVVDHGLRPESGDESTRVGAWLAARGIVHHILRWEGVKPAADIQAAARRARYELMTGWCRRAGVLHLAVGHHQEDQAETVLLRLARGSGVHGLSGMAPVVAGHDVRVLRPLLDQPRARLVATATAFGQSWVEDPGNQNAAYRRVRVRSLLLPALAAEGVDARSVAATAHRLRRAREAIDHAVAGVLAAAVMVHPFGFARLDPGPLRRAPPEVGLRALARVLTTIGGAAYPPRLERLERLYRALAGDALGRGRTLGGCVVLPHRGRVLVCREPAAVEAPVATPPGLRRRWDRRFVVETGADAPPGLRIGALGAAGWAAVTEGGSGRRLDLPHVVRTTLPAFFGAEGVLAVPTLGYKCDTVGCSSVSFTPEIPLTTA